MANIECQKVFQEIQEGKKRRYAILKITDGEINVEKVRIKIYLGHTANLLKVLLPGFYKIGRP